MSDDQPQRPTNDNRDAWRTYWEAQGMPWRTEPEIDEERQRFLAERRAIKPDILKAIYPFRDENGGIKLTRADVEWLLATHGSGGMRGPVYWDEPSQRRREGLDLRGAVLDGEDLHDMPLARLNAGLIKDEWHATTQMQHELASIHLRGATLQYSHLEGSTLNYAQLQGAFMNWAHLEGVDLYGARMDSEYPSSLARAYFDAATKLERFTIANKKGIGIRLADVHWGGVNISTIDWTLVRMLGEEYRARYRVMYNGRRIDSAEQVKYFQEAVRANRQLATVLRDQGLNEHADRFAYHAQVLQRVVLLRQGQFGRAFGSWLLDAIAGHGYKPMRSVFTYIFVVLGFAAAYFAMTNFGITPFLPPHSSTLAWYEAIVLSISSFHGRGLFPSGLSLGDPIAILAAGEAIIGLLIEITFIATFTQRFFSR